MIRPYDNWVLGQLDTTKTSDSEAIPMTPRLARALAKLKQRGYATSDEDFVFACELNPTARARAPAARSVQARAPEGRIEADQDV